MEELESSFPDVSFVRVDPDDPVPADLSGDVLFAQTFRPSNVADVLERGVRWVHSIGHGVDHLPLDLMGDRLVTCSRGASATPIAEWVVAMILTAVKNLPGSWAHEPPERWSWASLGSVEGQTVALVGFGSINRAVADRLRPFGADLVAVRRSRTGTETGVSLTDSHKEAVRNADHVVVAVPVTNETHHLVDADLLESMKPGSHLINVARGGLMDQAALVDALGSGHLGGAGLDVFEHEPTDADCPLYRFDNVVGCPHIAGNDTLALDEMVVEAAQCVIDLKAGRWPEGAAVNPELRDSWKWSND